MRWGKVISLVMLLLCIGCGKNETPTENNTFDAVLGMWQTTSYFTSGGYFVPATGTETFTFGSDGKFTHDNDGTISNGNYQYAPESRTIICRDSQGWDMRIAVTFEESGKAIFDISGKVMAKKVKVQRK